MRSERAVTKQRGDIWAYQQASQVIEVFAWRMPGNRSLQPFLNKHGRKRFYPLKDVGQHPWRSNRKRQAAIAHHDGRHSVANRFAESGRYLKLYIVVRVYVYETRRYPEPCGIDDFAGRFRDVRRYESYFAVFNRNIRAKGWGSKPVKQQAVLYSKIKHKRYGYR
jgi:hypothetical protein